MPLYKYVTGSTAESILGGRIRFTQPGAFNDPFELLPQIITPEGFDTPGQTFSFCLRRPRRKGIGRKVPKKSASNSDFQSRKIVEYLNSVVGILCLSRNPESLLMWGHYGEEYSGAIIEFDESHEFFSGRINVKYQKRRPVIDLEDLVGQEVPIADFCVKPNEWAYEREVRVIRPLSTCENAGKTVSRHALMLMNMPLECIRSVVIGERMPIDRQRAIWTLVKDTHIALDFAAVANWDYGFRVERIKSNARYNDLMPTITPRTAHIFKDELGQLGEMSRWLIEKHPASEFVNLPC